MMGASASRVPGRAASLRLEARDSGGSRLGGRLRLGIGFRSEGMPLIFKFWNECHHRKLSPPLAERTTPN